MPCAAAKSNAPQAWSPCSWVTRMPSISDGSRFRRASLRSVSRRLRPQSRSRRVLPASATRQLPLLPLASEAKRSKRLFQLLVQQREDALRGTRAFRAAVLVEHIDQAAVRVLLHLDAEVLGLGLGIVRTEYPREEAALAVLLVHLRVRIGVAHEVQALLPVAVLDGKADAVERQADAPPRPVERLVNLQQLIAVAAFFELRAKLHRRPVARGELPRL